MAATRADDNSPLRDDPAMQGRAEAERHPEQTQRLEDVGSVEARTRRRLTPDAGNADQDNPAGQRAPLPPAFDRTGNYEGSMSDDRESRQNPDMVVKGDQRGSVPSPNNETLGSQAQKSSTQKLRDDGLLGT